MKLDYLKIEHFVTPQFASQQLGISEELIFKLVDEGKLRAAILPDLSVGISQQSVYSLLPRESQPEYLETMNLRGNQISINEAGRKYHLNTSTITRWMQRGIIRQIGKNGNKTMVDEGDVAYCARVIRLNKGRGKWVFDKDGRPNRG